MSTSFEIEMGAGKVKVTPPKSLEGLFDPKNHQKDREFVRKEIDRLLLGWKLEVPAK